ncbi:hypothetical protein RvY_07463 [Ramazzottius varieornatus]|uniref:3-hydroxyanthranilate 3,4-dioxygenase n=1 Tax=Ramazzottius varieornatus TaxID=947166 RepID=A0A1D1V8D2_RAMVA|nr:hypothetical protein RvY_07463 [Ramazzottius varieornatus]
MSAFNSIPAWLNANSNSFAPPVCNRLMHGPDGQLFVMYVGGPNQRKDFHLEEGEELFYMEKGDMCLRVLEQGVFRDIEIKEGEVFLLPGKIPHSPQRFKDTVGLVIERQRTEKEEDCIRYFMEGLPNILFERWIHCTNLGTQIAPIISEYFASEEHETGKPSENSVVHNPPFYPDADRKLGNPFSIVQWLEENKDKMTENGKVRMFDESYQTDVFVVGGAQSTTFPANNTAEYWIWQFRGESDLVLDEGDSSDLLSRHYHLHEHCSYLVPVGQGFSLQPPTREAGSGHTIIVSMDPNNKERSRSKIYSLVIA